MTINSRPRIEPWPRSTRWFRAAILALLGFPGPLVGAAEPETIRVGLDTRSPPYAFIPGIDFTREDQTRRPAVTRKDLKRLAGFDLDVLKALAARMHVRATIVPEAWTQLERGLLEKRYDLILCGWTPTELTPSEIVASDPYYHWGLLVVARADGKVRVAQDLNEATIAHFPDPAVEKALSEMGRDRHFVTRNNAETLFGDLKRGIVDAVIFDSLAVYHRLRGDPTLRIVGLPLNRLGYHVGVRRADEALLARVQAAVRELKASPEMAEIKARWEGGFATER